mmetsp:Transcript_3001/g.4833  ORF Transcript_3001/g.4833 Transcript_3001/m.4833 type:complete len:591 (+) Transcript_3001:2-1774(+)
MLRSFSASLCTVTVDGDFPADPHDYFALEEVGDWPRACHCTRGQQDELRELLNRKTKVQVSATHANLAPLGLQPDPRMPIAAVMRHAERIEKLRRDTGPAFEFSDDYFFGYGLDLGERPQPLIDMGILREDEASRFNSDESGMDSRTRDVLSWKLKGKADIECLQYLAAKELLEQVWEKHEGPNLKVARRLSAEALSQAPPEQQAVCQPGSVTFKTFESVFGDNAQQEWEAAGAAGISDEERAAVADSQSFLAQVEAILQDPAWEAYALRVDFEVAKEAKGCSEGDGSKKADSADADDELDWLLRYMASGMSSTQSSFTIAHHCHIDRSEPGRIRVILQGLAHPVNSTKRKGLFSRSKRWWKQRAAKNFFDSGWQMVWRFAEHLRELSGGRGRQLNRFQLRWRTVCKAIKSRTLRRCGVPASSTSAYCSVDIISPGYKFLFFEGSEGFVDAKSQLLFNLRCRRIGFSRLPARRALAEKPDPYACDVHFTADAGVPLAWMWGLNVHGSMCDNVCQSSAEESSTAELRRHIKEATSSKSAWPQATVPRVPPEEWPWGGAKLTMAGVRDTDGSCCSADSEPNDSDSSDDRNWP